MVLVCVLRQVRKHKLVCKHQTKSPALAASERLDGLMVKASTSAAESRSSNHANPVPVTSKHSTGYFTRHLAFYASARLASPCQPAVTG